MTPKKSNGNLLSTNELATNDIQFPKLFLSLLLKSKMFRKDPKTKTFYKSETLIYLLSNELHGCITS